MKQLTIRGFDGELEQKIRELSRREGISLNRAALRLLRRGAGLEPIPQRQTVGDTFDWFIGSWSAEDAGEFEANTAELRRVDEDLWR